MDELVPTWSDTIVANNLFNQSMAKILVCLPAGNCPPETLHQAAEQATTVSNGYDKLYDGAVKLDNGSDLAADTIELFRTCKTAYVAAADALETLHADKPVGPPIQECITKMATIAARSP